MLARRQYLKGSEQIPSMMTETGMRHFIEVGESGALSERNANRVDRTPGS